MFSNYLWYLKNGPKIINILKLIYVKISIFIYVVRNAYAWRISLTSYLH